ncbi:unnamed protein product [Ascophyllum nodosum]
MSRLVEVFCATQRHQKTKKNKKTKKNETQTKVRMAPAAAEVPVHNRRTASEPTRPADDIGRKPDVPAGVGSTVNMYSGEARESHLAGIAAHDRGSGVLNLSFHRQPRVIPPVLLLLSSH